jgi:metal-responsive CopG/Arc/MetJ family transcriptional regulator
MNTKLLKRVIVVIDRALLKRIDRAAKQAKVNRSVFIRSAVERQLEAARG